MRKLIFPLALLLASGGVSAAERPPLAAQAGVLVGGMLGAVLGGPPGAIAGAALGGFTAERSHEAAKVDDLVVSRRALESEREALVADRDRLHAELDASRETLALERKLASEQASTASLAHGLAFSVPFPTDSATPPAGSDAGLAALAALLNAVPELVIEVDGYADPRGREDHNLALSQARAEALAERLVAAGVEPGRVRVAGRGALPATSREDMAESDGWALQRRASVRVVLDEDRLAARD